MPTQFTKIWQAPLPGSFFAATSNPRVWIFLPVFAVVCIASLVYVFARPPVYLSTARLQLEAAPSGHFRTEAASGGARPQTGVAPNQRQTEDRDTSPQLLAEVQTLTSSALLDQVSEQLSQPTPRAGDKIISADALQGMLSAVPVAGTSVIELRGEGSNRELLPQILNAWIDVYRQRHGDAYDQFSELTLDEARNVDTQLQQKLTAKRQALDQFRKKFDIVSQERDDNQALAQLKSLNTALSEARNREIKAEARVNSMRNNVAAGKAVQLPGDKTNISNLEQRAADLRGKMKELETEYSLKFLEIDPNYKAMRANVARLEQQIEHERQVGSQQALQGAEDELESARQTVLSLQKELAGRKREVQEFTTRFAEHNALMNELRQLEGSSDASRQRLTQLETEKSLASPKVTILTRPSVPERPLRPDYWRDALLGVVGSVVFGLIAVWLVEFLKRSGVPRFEPAARSMIHIGYSPSAWRDVPMPIYGAPVQQLTDNSVRLPRELSGQEVDALWSAASPDARLVIAALLSGLSIDEIAALRYEDIDFDVDRICVSRVSAYSYPLREPLNHLLKVRQAARKDPSPLIDAQGGALSNSDLEGLITCAACDAGMANPAEVTSEVLRHTYFAYLVRQGVRLADIADLYGRVAPAVFRAYGRLSPPGRGLPLGQVDPVFPALRGLDR